MKAMSLCRNRLGARVLWTTRHQPSNIGYRLNCSRGPTTVLANGTNATPQGQRLFSSAASHSDVNSSNSTEDFYFAASLGDVGKMQSLISSYDHKSVDYAGRTALHVAASAGQKEAVEYLLDAGANINAIDINDWTPLESAYRAKHNDIIRLLSQRGGEYNTSTKDTRIKALLAASSKGDIVSMTRILESSDLANESDYDMRYPLHLAAAEGHHEACQLLLDHGASVNVVDRFGNTPLADAQRKSGENFETTYALLSTHGALLAAEKQSTAKLRKTIQDVMPLLLDRIGFELVEAWIPSSVRNQDDADAVVEFMCHEYWHALPMKLPGIRPFADSPRGKTRSVSTRRSGAFSQCWKEKKPVFIPTIDEEDAPGRVELCRSAGFTHGILVPLLNTKGEVYAILQFFSSNNTTPLTPPQLDAFSVLAQRMMRAGYRGVPIFDELPDVDNSTDCQAEVFETLCNTSGYTPALIYDELEQFFGLGINGSYFKFFDTQTVARHISALIGCKKFASTTMDPGAIWMEVQNNPNFMGGEEGPEQSVLMVSLQHKRQLAAERRLQIQTDRVTSSHSFNLEFWRTAKPLHPRRDEKMGLYVLRTEPHPAKEAAPTVSDLDLIAGPKFLSRLNEETRARYQQLMDEAVTTLAPVYQLHEWDQRCDSIPALIAVRHSGVRGNWVTAITEMLHQNELAATRRSAVRFSNGFLVFRIDFEPDSDRTKMIKFLESIALLQLVPRSELITPAFLSGTLSSRDYTYAECAGRFVYYFVKQRSEEYDALCKSFGDQPINLSRLKNLHNRLKREAISTTRIQSVVMANLPVISLLADDFHERTSTKWIKEEGEQYPTAPPPAQSVVKAIRSVANTLDRQVLEAMHTFNQCVLKTNITIRSKSSLSFRLSTNFLDPHDWQKAPYGIFFVLGTHFQGFHIRFRDVSRGGIRLIVSRDRAHFRSNLGTLFAENYNLAYTQNNKNKDIPEFGSKGTILLSSGADPVTDGFNVFKAYVSGLMDLLGTQEIVDNYGEQELLFLGPDEGTANMMEWASQYGNMRGYPYYKALTTGKPPVMGGIPHDTYGMTTRSVHRYVVGCLRKMGLDETQVTKVQTGGPDGDLGCNEILISKDSTKCIVDGAGVVYDPNGLDRKEIERLAHARQMIDAFDESKLGEGGFKVLVTDTDVTLPTGELVESGLALRNGFHMHPLFEADVFVPCGGRPESVNLSNVNNYIKEDGTCRFKIIVEGANLFFSNDARDVLEKAGCVLFKDASSNKGGVTSSSLEVLAALAFPDEEFQKHMSVKDVSNPPEFYTKYCKEIQERVEHLADLEFECIWREHTISGRPRYLLTDAVSEKINDLTDFVHKSDTLWNNEALRRKVLTEAVPGVLVEQLSIETIMKQVPSNYLRATFATCLASRYVYKYGLHANEFSFFEFMQSY